MPTYLKEILSYTSPSWSILYKKQERKLTVFKLYVSTCSDFVQLKSLKNGKEL